MGLINLKTDFKSLRFGKDRFDGGSSNQPYIKKSIPDGSSTLNSLDNDFIWRNGIKTFTDTADDLVRIGKFFIDFKTPSGVLFIAKQNLLSRTGVKTQASGNLNDGAYLPTNTLAQVGVSAFGLHFNKQGLLPLGLTTYSDVVTFNQPSSNNRLVQLSGSLQKEVVNVLTYSGGPGSVLGVGDTAIKLADQRTGYNNPLYTSNGNYFFGNNNKPKNLTNVGSFLGASYYAGLTDTATGVNTNTNTVDLYFGVQNSVDVLITNKFAKLNNLGGLGVIVTENSYYSSENIKYNDRIYGTEGFNGEVYSIIPSSNFKDKQGASYAYSQYVPTSASAIKTANEQLNNFTPDIYEYGTLNIDPSQEKQKAGWITKTFLPGNYLQNINTSENPESAPLNGASNNYARLTDQPVEQRFLRNGLENTPNNVYNNVPLNLEAGQASSNAWPNNTYLINNQGNYTYTQQDLIDTNLEVPNPIGPVYRPVRDFRKILRDRAKSNPQLLASETAKALGSLTEAPDYRVFDRNTRLLFEDAGNRSNKSYANYTLGVRRDVTDTNPTGSRVGPLDKVNALPLYSSANAKGTEYTNDLVKFRIAAINNDAPSLKTYIHFRAFLESISDNYQSNWSDVSYLGRGEKFYNYTGFGRTISLGWTVAAQSKEELIPMYKKLNYLASLCAPDYSSQGYMRGNIIQLTVGGYLYEQPGIMTGMSLSIDTDTTWEIGLNTQGGSDDSVKELPHIIKVSGFNFTPIHRFVPRTQTLGFDKTTNFVNSYGNQRYIALSNGSNNNYTENIVPYSVGTTNPVQVF